MDFKPAKNCIDMPEVNIYQALGTRNIQEDHYVVACLKHGVLLAIADGHGGAKTSSLVSSHLVSIFSEESEMAIKSKKQAAVMTLSSYQARRLLENTINRLISLTKDLTSGSTLTVAFIETGFWGESSTSCIRVTVGQLGDSIFALSSKPGNLTVGPIHSVETSPRDVREIQEDYQTQYNDECGVFGGYIFSSSIEGQGSSLTRSLGDSAFTLLHKPELNTYMTNPSQSILMLASDGILTGQRNVRPTIKTMVEKIRSGESIRAIGDGIHPQEDNITILCIRFPS